MIATSDPTILALDAAGAACSAALWAGGRIAGRRWEAMDRGHAETLMPMARDVVTGGGFQDLDLVAVSIGPGAYTGLRIAIAAARGLGLALGIPVMGVSSLEVHLHLARNDGVTGPVAVLLETKRADFYIQAFGADDGPLAEPLVAGVPEADQKIAPLGGVTLVGDAVERFVAEATDHHLDQIVRRTQAADAAAVATLAAVAFAESLGADIAPPRPMYLRTPDTSPPAADRQRLRG